MEENERFAEAARRLDSNIGELNAHLDAGEQCTPGLLAGMGLARLWITQLTGQPGGWGQYRMRLSWISEQVTTAPEAGEVTNFGLADGLLAAAGEAERIESRG